MDDKLLAVNVEEARKRLGGVSRGLIYAAVRSGDLHSIRIGKRILIPIKSLERLMDQPPVK